MDLFDLAAERERLKLAPDCASCFGLCCVAHGFRASDSFAYDKLPGRPCRNLLANFDCGIHATLRGQGFSGCTAYTCYGAGQKVAQEVFGGNDWRQAPETADAMFQAMPMIRQLNELLWFITEALDRASPGTEFNELLDLLAATEQLTARAADMSWSDVDEHCLIGETLLGRVSATIRAAGRAGTDRRPDLPGTDLAGPDLRGADLSGADLRGVNLRGVVLSHADLSGADLRWADLMGADLGRANLVDADLSATIFLTQSQLELADGNAGTILSDPLRQPAHWS